jgi:hypothetical protein
MRKIREILRLLWECKLSQRQAATCCGISKTAVAECAARARHSGVSREAAAALSDTELEQRLYPPAEATALAQRPAVDWPEVHQLPSLPSTTPSSTRYARRRRARAAAVGGAAAASYLAVTGGVIFLAFAAFCRLAAGNIAPNGTVTRYFAVDLVPALPAGTSVVSNTQCGR